jgi:hypothetical protein
MRHIVWLLFLAVSLVACHPRDRLPLTWKPADVQLTCPSGECPDGAGMLIFVQKQKYDMRVVHCSGTLVSDTSVLSNSHCDFVHEKGYQGYFFLPTAQGTAFAPVSGDSFRVKGKISGLDRDLAILTLGRPLAVEPRKIARKIPAKMDSLVGFVANRRAKNRYSLDKEVCKTIPKMALYGGGVSDRNTGLALLDCDIKRGNSGAAMFLPDRLDEIQVVVNTIWKFVRDGDDRVFVQSLFFDLPNYFKTGYAMGERVHCQHVKGWSEPETNCLSVDFERTMNVPFRNAVTAEVLKRLPKQNAGNIVWTTEAIQVRTGNPANNYPERAVILAPKPFCYRGGKSHVQELTFAYLRLGLYPDGRAETRLLAEDHMTVLAQPAESGQVKLVYSRRPSAQARDFLFAPGEREKFKALASPANVHQLPRCDANAERDAESYSLQALVKIGRSRVEREVSF